MGSLGGSRACSQMERASWCSRVLVDLISTALNELRRFNEVSIVSEAAFNAPSWASLFLSRNFIHKPEPIIAKVKRPLAFLMREIFASSMVPGTHRVRGCIKAKRNETQCQRDYSNYYLLPTEVITWRNEHIKVK